MTPQIERIFEQQRQAAQRYDWSTAKGILAAVGTAHDVVHRMWNGADPPPSGAELATAVEQSKAEFRELWADEAGYGLGTLGEIAAALRSMDER